jgi:hypothetical protein
LIRYFGDSAPFYVSAHISDLSNGSFRGNDDLQSVIFDPNSRVRRFAASAFAGAGLRSISVPKCIRMIGPKCFLACCELSEVSFDSPVRIREIGSCAFSACDSLSFLAIPSSVSTLGDSVFRYCDSIRCALHILRITFSGGALVSQLSICRTL